MSSSLRSTQLLKQIVVDYTPSACQHSPSTDEIHLTYDHRGGARWRSPARFRGGVFRALIRCPRGNTSGLNFNLYLSSLEGDKSQDEIDFEFLGRDLSAVQTNLCTNGVGSREGKFIVVHPLGFNASDGFHEYSIDWGMEEIEWAVDGVVIRKEVRKEGEAWPEKPMFLYASVWDASGIDEGRWTGEYVGGDEPYVCWYKDVRVPVGTMVVGEEEEEKKA